MEKKWKKRITIALILLVIAILTWSYPVSRWGVLGMAVIFIVMVILEEKGIKI